MPNQNEVKKKPLLSIIVPVYNVEGYLARCIESILGQSYTELQLILVDDGSTDSSYNICRHYQEKDHRVLVLQQTNAGSSVARNTGLQKAKGEFIGFVDSDDWILPTMYEEMVSLAISSKLQVVECGHGTSKNVTASILPKTTFNIETKEQAMERIIRKGSFAVWRRLYHRETLSEMRFIPGKIHQDVFFTMDVIDKIQKLGVLDGKYYVYNTENESVIRSAYSLKKLDAKDAVYYVQKISSKYNPTINDLGNKYLIRGLINHYKPLFGNEHLDNDYKHRRQIKAEIKQYFHLLDNSLSRERLEGLLVLNTPFWVYKGLLNLNDKRIALKLKLLKLFNV